MRFYCSILIVLILPLLVTCGVGVRPPEGTLSSSTPLKVAPKHFAASVSSDTEVTLSWDPISGATYYELQTSQNGESWTLITAQISASLQTYTHSGLTGTTRYYYRIRALNDSGPSPFSSTVAATTLFRPSPPLSLTSTSVSESTIAFSWTNQSADQSMIKLERMPYGGSWSEIATLSGSATSYSDSGLTDLTHYSYRLRATGSAGDSVYSSTFSAFTYWFGSAFSDNFDSGVNSVFWTLGPTSSASSGAVFVSISPPTTFESADSVFYAKGDYDVRVNFSGLTLPACAMDAVGLYAVSIDSTGSYNIERRPGTLFSDVPGGNVADGNLSGIFRIRRVGNITTVYRTDGVTALNGAAGTTSPMYFRMYARADTGACSASGYFDDFTLQ